MIILSTLTSPAGFRRFATTVVLGFTLVGLGACKKAEESTATVDAGAVTPSAALTFNVGDKIDINWKGGWWKGDVLEVQDGKYRVHYTGWASSWDETATPDRVRAQTADSKSGSAAEPGAAPAASAVAAHEAVEKVKPAPVAFKVGENVDINWKGAWWQGKVLSVQGNSYKVHYVGWESSWDEVAPTSRLRKSTGSAQKGKGPT